MELETKHGHYGAKWNKVSERTKKRKLEDHQRHWASRQIALVSPNVPDQHVTEQFRDVVLHCPMLQNMKLLKDNAERR
ncbi:hypothetical protein H5410_005452 [Solanum commersonii]|uniref:Uncharacterized protein n=1 Tax=Solanum commersonii TaxID=4109 RepID=A0A9J6A7C2_SOLCO|nr:hypothetical protein H5410_005452 [Solanum commersonii]